MEIDFYKEWLEIPPDQRPPNHYQLLGIQQFEPSNEAIEKAARERAALLKAYQIGQYSAQSQVLLTEVARARADLQSAKRKAEYDRRLRGGEKAPQIEVDSLEIFTNLVAFSLPRGNLSRDHIASLVSEAKRLKIPQKKAETVIKPLLVQAKKLRQAENAAREEAERKKEEEERAAKKKAATKKVGIAALVLVVVVAGAYYALQFRSAVEKKKKVEQVQQEKRQEKNERDELLAKAAKAQKQEKWQKAAEHYKRALELGEDKDTATKLAAMNDILQAIQLESERKWADAAASYTKGRKGMGDPKAFDQKLAFLSLAHQYETAYKDGETQEKAGKRKEACVAFEKAKKLASEARLETDADKRLAALKEMIGNQAERVNKARHLLTLSAKRKDHDALYAAASFYLSRGGPQDLRALAEPSKATAEKALKAQSKPTAKPEDLLASCATHVKEKRFYQALRDIGTLRFHFADSRLCQDEAYQTELLAKAGKDTPKTLKEMLARCVAFGESICPECMGSGRLPCRLCHGTGKTEQTCDACAGRGRIHGCETCNGTGLQIGPCFECKGTGTWRCKRCRGKGCKFCQNNPKRKCTACKGTGKAPTRKKCPRCAGKGKVGGKTCPVCKGKKKPICETCGGSGTKPCAKCNGTGKIQVPCRLCSRGRFRKCVKCRGTGQLKKR